MESFITGSRAYGKPGLNSDVDLVVRMDNKTCSILQSLSDQKGVIRFGRLNIIACTTDEELAVWRLGTSSMQDEARRHKSPYDRDRAKAVFDVLRKMVRLPDYQDSQEGPPNDDWEAIE